VAGFQTPLANNICGRHQTRWNSRRCAGRWHTEQHRPSAWVGATLERTQDKFQRTKRRYYTPVGPNCIWAASSLCWQTFHWKVHDSYHWRWRTWTSRQARTLGL